MSGRTRDVINTQMTTVISPAVRKKFVYDVVDPFNCLYIGIAPRGSATSEDVWTIVKFAYDGNNNNTDQTVAFDAWDNYLTASYG